METMDSDGPKYKLLVLIAHLLDELKEQRRFLSGIGANEGKRFFEFALGLEMLVCMFDYFPPLAPEDRVKWLLDSFRASIEDQQLLTPDWEWLLEVTHDYVLNDTGEESACEFKMKCQEVLKIESVIPLNTGHHYTIKDDDYLIGATFAKATDRWVHPVKEYEKDCPELMFWRLSELLPLEPEDFKLNCLPGVDEMELGIGRDDLLKLFCN